MNSDIPPDEAQQTTIQSYNQHVTEYIDKDSSDDVRTLAYWPGVQYFLDKLPAGEYLLEIGSGTGGDALRIEKQGFRVQRSDITQAFIKHMRSQGHVADLYDVLHGPYPKQQAAIFSNAVFLHFTAGQFQTALTNVFKTLRHGGLFCLGMKLGDFEGWREKGLSGKRYFKFWKVDDLQTALTAAGFSVVHVFVTPDNDFVVITAQKD